MILSVPLCKSFCNMVCASCHALSPLCFNRTAKKTLSTCSTLARRFLIIFSMLLICKNEDSSKIWNSLFAIPDFESEKLYRNSRHGLSADGASGAFSFEGVALSCRLKPPAANPPPHSRAYTSVQMLVSSTFSRS